MSTARLAGGNVLADCAACVADLLAFAALHTQHAANPASRVPLQDLCGALDTNTRCVTLYASGHAMSATASAGLAATLAANTTLRRLCVGDARFGDAALAALGPGLGAACSLRELDLENKGLSAVGVRQLLDDLQRNTALETLILSRNDLAQGGFVALASRPLCLQRLVLRSCALRGAELAGARPTRCARARASLCGCVCAAQLSSASMLGGSAVQYSSGSCIHVAPTRSLQEALANL